MHIVLLVQVLPRLLCPTCRLCDGADGGAAMRPCAARGVPAAGAGGHRGLCQHALQLLVMTSTGLQQTRALLGRAGASGNGSAALRARHAGARSAHDTGCGVGAGNVHGGGGGGARLVLELLQPGGMNGMRAPPPSDACVASMHRPAACMHACVVRQCAPLTGLPANLCVHNQSMRHSMQVRLGKVAVTGMHLMG